MSQTDAERTGITFAISEHLRYLLSICVAVASSGCGFGRVLLHGVFGTEPGLQLNFREGQWWSVPAAVLLGIPLYSMRLE